jgi:hypothetical protein
MTIRSFQPGDLVAQARIYNAAARSLPGFKPATVEELARRHSASDFDPRSRFYALDSSDVVGYAVFAPNGRVSVPWCMPGAESVRAPLLDTVLAAMRGQGLGTAWAAYRADWSPVLEFFSQHAFVETRRMVNYVADVARMPEHVPLPRDRVLRPVNRQMLAALIALAPEIFADSDPAMLERFFWGNPFHDFSNSLVALEHAGTGELRGAGVLVVDSRFADPAKIDPAMPCFRLGSFGTEGERHKRVNGLFSAVFADPLEGDLLLAALAGTKAREHGLTHVAAQAPTSAAALCGWYDRWFGRQGAFPIVSRSIAGPA